MTTFERTRRPGIDDAEESNIRRDVEQVREGLGSLTHDAGELASHTAESVMSGAKSAVEHTKAAHQQFEGYVTRHPTTTVLMALGVGALIGRFVVRR